MQTYTLARTGDSPLRFDGEHIAGTSTQRTPGGQDRNRWFEIDLYRTRGGTFVLAIVYQSLYQDEHTVSTVIPCQTPEAVRDELRCFDPLEHVLGYPTGEAYREKQARLERMLRLDWANGVKELFEAVTEEFAEEIA